MNQDKYKLKIIAKLKRNPIIYIFTNILNDKNFFIAIIGTIVAVASLLQVPEIRCMANLPQEKCLNDYLILLTFLKFFYFLVVFGICFFPITVGYGVFIPFLGYFLQRTIKYLQKSIKYNLLIQLRKKSNFRKIARKIYKFLYKIQKNAFFQDFIADPINEEIFLLKLILKLISYLFAMWMGFVHSFAIAKNTTPFFGKLIELLFRVS